MTPKASTFLFLLFTLSICIIHSAEAQREYIIVTKALSNKKIQYSSGDKISYKLKYEDFFRTDHIVALNDSSIEFHYNQILYTDISQIDVKGQNFTKFNYKSAGTKIQIVGIAYIAIDQFNQVVVHGEDASFNQGVWIAGGSIFLAGSIMKWIAPKKIKLGGKYTIKYINLK